MKYRKVEVYEYCGKYYETLEEVEKAVENGLWSIIEEKVAEIIRHPVLANRVYEIIGSLNNNELQMIRKKIRNK